MSKLKYSVFVILSVMLMSKLQLANAGTIIMMDKSELVYPEAPNETHDIQPVLLFPKMRTSKTKYLTSIKDNEIIYVKLLRENYRPNFDRNKIIDGDSFKSGLYEIFYVKAPTNGQFSAQRLKWFRTPEFYEINVYKKFY